MPLFLRLARGKGSNLGFRAARHSHGNTSPGPLCKPLLEERQLYLAEVSINQEVSVVRVHQVCLDPEGIRHFLRKGRLRGRVLKPQGVVAGRTHVGATATI